MPKPGKIAPKSIAIECIDRLRILPVDLGDGDMMLSEFAAIIIIRPTSTVESNQTAGTPWGIDTVMATMRSFETEGSGRNRKDCARQFKAAWERFASR